MYSLLPSALHSRVTTHIRCAHDGSPLSRASSEYTPRSLGTTVADEDTPLREDLEHPDAPTPQRTTSTVTTSTTTPADQGKKSGDTADAPINLN